MQSLLLKRSVYVLLPEILTSPSRPAAVLHYHNGGQKIAKKAAAAGLFSTEDEDVFKDLLTSVVNLQLGTAGEDPEKKFSSDEELSEKLGEVLFALCRFCTKYKVSGEMALLKKLEEF